MIKYARDEFIKAEHGSLVFIKCTIRLFTSWNSLRRRASLHHLSPPELSKTDSTWSSSVRFPPVVQKSSQSLPKVRLFKSLPKVRRRLLKSVLVRRYFETNTAINPYRFPSFHEDEELGPYAAGASPAREGEPGEASAR